MWVVLRVLFVTVVLGHLGHAATVQVSMKDNFFYPDLVVVTTGDTVKWINNDDRKHDVAADGKTFVSEAFGLGGTFVFVFTTSGRFPYKCTLHARNYMVGAVVVQGSSGVQPLEFAKVSGPRDGAQWRDVMGRRINPSGGLKIRIPEKLPATP